MSGTEEDMPAIQGPAAPAPIAGSFHRHSRRLLHFAAIVAAILFLSCLPFVAAIAQTTLTFRHMPTETIQASSSFQSLISTICWLVGFGFVVNGCIRLYRALRLPVEDPVLAPLWRPGILYLFLGLGCFSFPFVQNAFAPPYYGIGYTSARVVEEHDASLKMVSFLCWYFCLAFFLNADLTLREALRLKDDPAAARLKTKSAMYFLLGFTLLAAPAIYRLWTQ